MSQSLASRMQGGSSSGSSNGNGHPLPDSGFAFRLNDRQYGTGSKNSATKDEVASFVHRWLEKEKDPASGIKGMPPLFGQDAVPHAMTFQSLIGSYAKTYLPSDESLEKNPNDAILMRKDLGIMECLEIRQRMTALLDWSIVPEDAKSPAQKSLAAEITKIVKRIKRFTEYRRCLMEGVWAGKSAIQHRPGYMNIGGKEYVGVKPLHADSTGWKHINGDKIVFRYDDGREMQAGQYPDQMGIRVSAVLRHDCRFRGLGAPESTNSGMALFLSPAERNWIICHKHMIEDAEYTNPRKAGRIHGVGIRDRIYNEWFLKQETLGFLMEYLERSAGGIEIWEYPSGDEQAKNSIIEAAKNRMANGRNQLFFPKPMGMDGNPYDLRIVEPGFTGIDMLLNIQDKYFGHRIKRYIIGQTLTTEADSTGMGSGVADAHKDTLSQIVRYDSANLEETLTDETVRPLHLANWPETEQWRFELKLELESDNAKETLDAYQAAWNIGAGIPEKDVCEAIGVSLDNPNEKILRNLQAGAAPQPAGGGMGFPAGTQIGKGHAGGPGVAGPGHGGSAEDHAQHGADVSRMKGEAADHVVGKVGGADGKPDGSPPSSADQYQRRSNRLLDEAASSTNSDPTLAQIEAGNYQKGQFAWRGLEIAIENPKGSIRTKTSPSSGRTWSRKMASHYGYFRRTTGKDGDQLDVFIGNHPDSDYVLVIKQVDQDGKFDEFKVVIGCLNRKSAKRLYLANYPAGWKCGPAAGMTADSFKRWVAKGGASKGQSLKGSEKYGREFVEEQHPRDQIGEFAVKENKSRVEMKKHFEHNPWSSPKNGVSKAIWDAGKNVGADGITRSTPYQGTLQKIGGPSFEELDPEIPFQNWALAVDDETGEPPYEYTFEIVRDVDSVFGVTNTGNAREVIEKAAEALAHAIHWKTPTVIYFTAAEKSRSRLYERMAKIANGAKSWDGKEYSAYKIDGIGDEPTVFVIARNDVDLRKITKETSGTGKAVVVSL